MMKRLLALLPALATVFTLTACGKKEPQKTQTKEPVDQAAAAQIRSAVSLLIDRNYIVEQIAQGGQEPAASYVAMGMTDADGSQFYQNANGGSGYYDVSPEAYGENYGKAIDILSRYYTYDETTGKFSDFPTLTFLYNTDENHKAVGEYLQSVLGAVGIPVNLENQEWNTFLSTRKNGGYSIARNGWVADFNDPICFLDMWTSDSGNNDIGLGKQDHSTVTGYGLDLTAYGYDISVKDGTWAQTYDVLIRTVKSSTDREARYAMMHLAEDMLMGTGCVMPLYYYTDLYMLSSSVMGFYSNPLGYKYFQHTTVGGRGDAISVCLASEPESLDPALNSTVDGGTLLCHLFAGLAKWERGSEGEPVIVPDCAEALPGGVSNSDGSVTYTYTLREGLKWSDGRALTAGDFVYAWNRGASDALGADYGYMFEPIRGYGSEELEVRAVDDRTLTVTLSTPIPYWEELLAFPAYFPVRQDIVQHNEAWATEPDTYVCNGAYTMTGWQHDSLITLEKNGNYHDADGVSMQTVRFFLSDDTNNMLTNYKNGTWQLIDNVPTNEIGRLKSQYPQEFFTVGQIGTYYLCWNINMDLSPK